MSAILEIVKSPYLNEKSSNFDEIWYTIAHLELDGSQLNIFKIQDDIHVRPLF